MLKNKSFLIVAMATLLSACQTMPKSETGIETREVKVEVPIPVKCKTETPPPPEFCFSSLKESDNIFVKARCLLSDRKKHIAYEIKLNAALDSCK